MPSRCPRLATKRARRSNASAGAVEPHVANLAASNQEPIHAPHPTSCLLGLALLARDSLPAMAQTLPPEQASGSVTYVSGGITMDEAAVFKAAAPATRWCWSSASPATPRAEYLANVEVSIADMAEREVLRTRSDGPFLLAQFLPGTYRVSAGHEAGSRHRWCRSLPAGAVTFR